MGLGSHEIFVPGHKSRKFELGFGLILFGPLGLEQISLGQSRDKNLWNSQIHVFSKNSKIPGLTLELESQAVPKSSNGRQIPGTLGTASRIAETVPGF